MTDRHQRDSPLRHTALQIRQECSVLFWKIWRGLPITPRQKGLIVGFAFRWLPLIFSWTRTYENWKITSLRSVARNRQTEEGLIENQAGAHFPKRDTPTEPSSLKRPARLLARTVAFYLPQFHPIPENDHWWVPGFTEWTNVRRARPLFEGHRQPRRPGELGYYDLLADPAIRRRQAALASQYGLEGFCFYYYWFGGRQLLEQPVEAYAADSSIRFPFCLCWANESWSRRWDGKEEQLLIAQYHSPEDDIAFIENVRRYLSLDTYLRINGRPLLIVYRPDLLPDAKATAARWRGWCRQNGIGEIFLAYTLSFANGSPEDYGFDAAIEFPPNNMGLSQKPGLVTPTSNDFSARIYDLSDLINERTPYQRPDFRLFRGVTPQWDNTARRMANAAVMLDGGPEAYENWLRSAAMDMVRRERSHDARLVFINAWNEWAEGAYLEPDLDHGYAWLAATRRALTAQEELSIEPRDLVPAESIADSPKVSKVILVVHDLWRNGAQIHSLYLARTWLRKFGYEVTTIACDDGPLRPNFAACGPLIILKREMAGTPEFTEAISQLYDDGYRHAIINSSAGGWLTPHLSATGIDCVGLVHELPDIIRTMNLQDGIKGFEDHARKVVFASDYVKIRSEQEILGRPWSNPFIQPQGLYKSETILSPQEKDAAADEVRSRLCLPEDAIIILGAGYGDARKGPDIFCRWGVETARIDPRCYFIWIGGLSADMRTACHAILANAGALADHVRLVDFQSDTSLYFKAASAYALSSREDPYPSTVLEALACGTPAFLVSGTTGFESLKPHPALFLLADTDSKRFTARLTGLLGSPEECDVAFKEGLDLIRQSYGFQSFAGDLLRLAGLFHPRISVVIPNYNYARFLPHRIATILNQELPVWEIIFLDDASSDDSLKVAEQLLKSCGIHYRIIPNKENSGSVFAQWKKGAELARGDIIWIAEADDWAGARFTRIAASAFRDKDVVVSYTQSNQVNENSEILCPHYLDYVADIDRERWRRPFIHDGQTELVEGLSVKNTIPNVSGVLFRREALMEVLDKHMGEITSYRVAGDWCVYSLLAGMGKIAFDPRPLNYHRRHTDSVTISRFTQAEWDEIARMQAFVQTLADVPAELKQTANAYLDELKKRL